MRVAIKTALMASSIFIAWPALCEDGNGLADAVAAYQAHDYARSKSILTPLATAGDQEAQYRLGELLWSGMGGPIDYTNALRWFRMASEQGYAPAQASLAMMHFNGTLNWAEANRLRYSRRQETPERLEEARRLGQLAAGKGDPAGQYMMALLYYYGAGAPKDKTQADRFGKLAFSAFLPLAEAGDPIAQKGLGRLYNEGLGVSQNDAEAVRWYRLAADQGNATAQSNLGLMYENGRGVPQNDAEAVRWYRLAADQGNAIAQTNLGLMYENGRGVFQDYREAVRWYRLAADQGYAPAQFKLGAMYILGQGVSRKNKEAAWWYDLAAAQGNELAQYALANMHMVGLVVEKSYSEAKRLFRLAADQGYAPAQFKLGEMYWNGSGGVESNEEAVRWYLLAAEQGVSEAQTNLGRMYQDSRGDEKNEEAVRWFRSAADKGNSMAQYTLGKMYENGYGVPRLQAEALRLYRLAAAQGYAGAKSSLYCLTNTTNPCMGVIDDERYMLEELTRAGIMYEEGAGFNQDYTEALRLYRLAADQGDAWAQSRLNNLQRRISDGLTEPRHGSLPHPNDIAVQLVRAEQGNAEAQYKLGLAYRDGEGFPRNDLEAARWFRFSSDQGYAKAQFALGKMYQNGQGAIRQDYSEAERLYNLAAEGGYVEAQLDRAQRYNISAKEKMRWYRLAADQGNELAQLNLGMMYEKGEGVAANYPEAMRLYRLAAAQGNETAQANLEDLQRRRSTSMAPAAAPEPEPLPPKAPARK